MTDLIFPMTHSEFFNASSASSLSKSDEAESPLKEP
jgi:hypothetical protein